MKVESKQRNRRNRKLARKRRRDPAQAKSRLRKMRRTRVRGKYSRDRRSAKPVTSTYRFANGKIEEDWGVEAFSGAADPWS